MKVIEIKMKPGSTQDDIVRIQNLIRRKVPFTAMHLHPLCVEVDEVVVDIPILLEKMRKWTRVASAEIQI